MSRIADFFPVPIESREDRTAAERAKEAAKPGVGRAVLDALNSEWSTSWAFRQLSGAGYPADPDFIIDDGNFNEFTKDVPPHLWSMFDEAKSLEHANKIRGDALSIAGSRDRLASIGWKGTGLRIGAAIFDPVDLTIGAAAGAVSGGIGAAAGVATKATRLQRMLRAGFIGSASAIPVQAYISSQDPEQDELDVLYAGIGGFLGGSISGIWAKTRLKDAAADAVRDIEAGDTVRFAMGAAGADEFNIRVRDLVQNNVLTDEGKAYFREQFNPERQARLLESRIARSGLDPVEDADIIAEIRGMDPIDAFNDSRLGPVDGVEFPAELPARNPNLRPPTEDEISARAAQLMDDDPELSEARAREYAIEQIAEEDSTRRGIKPDMTPKDKGPAGPVGPPPPRQFKPGDLNLDGHSDAPAAATGLRRSYASILGAENLPPEARAVASMLAEDALMRTDGTAGRASASTWVRRSTLGTLAPYYRDADDAARAFFRREGTTLFGRQAARTDLAEQAGKAMRLNPSRIQDKIVLSAVKASRRAINQAFEIAKRAGVRGLDELEAADDYFPRIYSLPKINTLTTTHGNETLEQLFTAAIKGGTPTIDDAMAEKLGKGVLKIIRGTGEWSDLDKARLLSGGNRDGWVKILRDEFPGIDDAKIDSILGPKLADDAGNIDRAKHRLLLNEQATVTTEDGRNLAFGEMLNNDIDQVTELYVRQMNGAAAEAELLRAANNKFGTDFTSWDGLKAYLGDKFNKAKHDKAFTDEKMRLLDNLRSHVRGIPVYPNTTFARVLRRIQGVNYALRSGGFGIAQIPELANIVEEAGVRAMMSQFVPALGAMVDQARKGRFTNEMFADLEATLGSGAEWLTRRFHDKHAGEILTGADLAITKFDRGLDSFNRAASIISGMRHVDQFSKLWAASSLAQRFVNIASAGRTPSLKRLNSMGIRDVAQWEQLSAAIRAEQKAGTIRFEKGVLTGRRVANLNIDDWADQDSAALFIDILDKTSTRAIQVNDIGNLHPVFDNPLGRAVFQFRSFHIASWDKALARGVQMRDIDTFMKVSFGTMLAAMVYSAQQYANSIGREDAEEFREKNLSRRAVASAAIQRSGWASMLPQFAEEAWGWSGGQGAYGPLFDARNTGLRSGVFSVDGTPMLALPREIGRAAAGVGGVAFGDDFTRKDARAVSQLLPFKNVLGFKNVLESLIQQFPEDE